MFARGFKSWCETIAVQRRRSLNLRPADPLPPEWLAESMGVDVRPLGKIPGLDTASKDVLLHEDPGSWSAVTLTEGDRSLVILNPAHSPARTASDLTHELAHLLVGHRAGRVDVTEDGSLMLNTYDRLQEDEANWLAGSLLLPRPALLWIARQRMDTATAAQFFGVSTDMLVYRQRVTGVEHQVRRAQALRGRRAG